MKTKLLLGTAILALSLPMAASAANYEKSIVLDARANAVRTKDGVCVTHNFPERHELDCKGAGEVPNVVYFSMGSTKLDAKGKRVVDEVANAVKGSSARVHLSAHADRVASAGFNQKLSQNRAAAVKKALVARGVDADAITTEAHGEGQNAVPTKDGVAQKLNRRVEIEITN